VTGVPALPFPHLADDAVALRPWRPADVPALVRAYADPAMRRFSWRPEPYTEADARAFLAAQEEDRQAGTAVSVAVVGATGPVLGGPVLGGASVYDVDPVAGRAAVGYWLTAAARGRGVASRAVRLLAGWAFGQLGTARLELTCGPDNVASQRVAERCGFTREGVLRSHVPFQGGRRDTVLFSLLPGELR
jgi:RimJ/RimL family protein N-acetyltransferase